MVQLNILSGKMAGTEKVARRFPFCIGRATAADLQVEDDGVWDRHLELAFDSASGFVLTAQSGAIAAINGKQFQQVVLRNGDAIEIGALKIRFWLGKTRQSGLYFWEAVTWTSCILILAAQFALIYWLVR